MPYLKKIKSVQMNGNMLYCVCCLEMHSGQETARWAILGHAGFGAPQLLAGRGPLWWPRGSCGQRRLQKVIKANQWEKAGP